MSRSVFRREPVRGSPRASEWPHPESTLKLPIAALDASALALLRGDIPAPEPITEERSKIIEKRVRHDTPHTIVLPVAVRADRATLTMIGGPEPGATFTLADDETIIGRGAGSSLILDDASVSRNHARIVCVDDRDYVLEDLRSTNGTFVR